MEEKLKLEDIKLANILKLVEALITIDNLINQLLHIEVVTADLYTLMIKRLHTLLTQSITTIHLLRKKKLLKI